MRNTVTSADAAVQIRDEISEKVATFLDLSGKTKWTVHELHNSEACLCNRGQKGEEERAAANEKCRAYYKTEVGLKTKKAYGDNVKCIEERSYLS